MCRTFSILLSLLIILNSSGYVLIYIERLANNKHDIEAIIATSKDLSAFEKFIFTKEDFKYKLNWKDEKEFELNGNMFDIAKIEIKPNKVIVYCIQDDKEEELISSFEKVNNENNSKDKIHFSHTLINTFNFTAIENDSYRHKRISNLTPVLGCYFNNYHSVFLESPTPPPRFV